MKLENWFTAIVTNVGDPLNAGRVQIRCYEYHSIDENALPDEYLPWACPMMPLTSASNNGTGTSATGLVVGSWVFGFFRDQDNQDPVIIGSIPGVESLNGQGIPEGAISTSIGISATSQYITNAPIGSEAQMSAFGDPPAIPDNTVYSGSTSGGNITEAHNGTRNQPLNGQLKSIISRALAGTGLNWYSVSGGQPPFPQGPRVGSKRHDGGNATDGDFVDISGRTLNADNPTDRLRIARALSRLKAAGIEGVGWDSANTGNGHYMGSQRFHLDISGAGTWGAEGKGSNTASWVSTALNTPATLDGDSQEEMIFGIANSDANTADDASTPLKSNSALANKLVNVARGEIGKTDSKKYGATNFGWDATFVGWCLGEIGIPAEDLPKNKTLSLEYIKWVNGAGKKYVQSVGDDTFKPGDIVITNSSIAIITVGCSNRRSGIYNFVQGDALRPIAGQSLTNKGTSTISTQPNNNSTSVHEYKINGNNMSSWHTVLRWNDGT